MADYRLAPLARDDLRLIWHQGAARWGQTQADRYLGRLFDAMSLIAAFPALSRLRQEFHPPLRVHPCAAHVIVYREDETGQVVVYRILYGRQDLLTALGG